MRKPLVTVFCLTYNHEKYIEKALKGFVSQATSFPFEVIVHDDASTDQTANIVRKYAEQYPDTIKPIYESENQYSKGINIIRTICIPVAKGKYYAWCEGDDFWCDQDKLQKQIDFLESYPEYSCCGHKVCFNNLFNGGKSSVPMIDKEVDYDIEDFLYGGLLMRLSSVVIRADLYNNMPSVFLAKGFGDYQICLYSALCGKVHIFPDEMSVYNHGTTGSWSSRKNMDLKMQEKQEKEMLNMLKRVYEYYGFQHQKAFEYAITRAEFKIILRNDVKAARKKPYRNFYIQYKKQQLIKYLSQVSLLRKMYHLILK